jgi:hypothetical protein
MIAPIESEMTIAALVEMFLPMVRASNQEALAANGYREGNIDQLAIHICLDMSARYSGYLEDGNTMSDYEPKVVGNYIHFLFLGNVTVFAAVTKEPNINMVPTDRWENTSNHDSCWRSDGLRPITHTYFNLCERVQAHLPKELKVAPKDVHFSSHMKGYCDPVKFVAVSYEKSGSYKRTLTAVRPVITKLGFTKISQK